jgi:GntR family transcriptional repressor for pyruvate dehydrogenase complex
MIGTGPGPSQTIPRRPRRLATEVAEALRGQIHDCALRPGDKLPTESEIMRQHGVSRTVVREAISRLQAAGYVDTRHGIGTFVLDCAAGIEFRVEPASIPTVRDILSMLELRIGLECEAASLAAIRRTADQLADMRSALDAFQAALDSGRDTSEPDYQFHLRVAEATGNRYYAEVLARFGTTTIPRARLTVLQSAGDQAAYLSLLSREHEQIYGAILRGDAEDAARFMRTHLANSRDRFQRAQDALGLQ